MSIFRLRSIAQLLCKFTCVHAYPASGACTAKTTRVFRNLCGLRNVHTKKRVEQLCSCPQLGERGLFHHFQVCCSSTAVPDCKTHSMNEPRGASSETVAHWLCLNGSSAVIGRETHQLLFEPPNSHLRKAFARGLLVVP